jgi:hypothetical protein
MATQTIVPTVQVLSSGKHPVTQPRSVKAGQLRIVAPPTQVFSLASSYPHTGTIPVRGEVDQ